MSLTLALALVAQAAAPAPLDAMAVRDACSAGNFAQVEYAACLRRKAAESEQVLQAAMMRATKRIDAWDEDVPYRAAAKAALAAANAPFARYRVAQCAFASSLSGGGAGNSHEVGRLACVYELNMQRAATLDRLVGKLPPR